MVEGTELPETAVAVIGVLLVALASPSPSPMISSSGSRRSSTRSAKAIPSRRTTPARLSRMAWTALAIQLIALPRDAGLELAEAEHGRRHASSVTSDFAHRHRPRRWSCSSSPGCSARAPRCADDSGRNRVMPITVKLDDLLHARRMTLTELAERIDLDARQPLDPQDRQGQGDPLLDPRGDLPRAGLPARANVLGYGAEPASRPPSRSRLDSSPRLR